MPGLWFLPIDISSVSWWRRTHAEVVDPVCSWKIAYPGFDLRHPLEATNDATMVLTVFQAMVLWSIHAIWAIETNLCHFFFLSGPYPICQWCFFIMKANQQWDNGQSLMSISCSLLSVDSGYYWTWKNFFYTITSSWPTHLSKSLKSLSPEKDHLILAVSWVMIRKKKIQVWIEGN